MPAFGAFAPFGLLSFGESDALASPFYRSMVASVDAAFDCSEGTHMEASIYARAMSYAAVRATLRHGFNQRRAAYAVELLPALERSYGITPDPRSTMDERRRVVADRAMLGRGARPESIWGAMQRLLGTSFLGIYTTTPGTAGVWPAAPEAVGVWDDDATPARFFKLTSSMHMLGVPVEFTYENLLEDGVQLEAGITYAVEPEVKVLAEAVTITSSSTTENRATATFTKVHNIGAIIRSHAPVWTSTQRHIVVVVTPAAAADAGARQRIDDALGRRLRATTTWSIVTNTGPFTLDSSPLGLTPLGTLTL